MNYNHQKYGRPTWKRLAKAVGELSQRCSINDFFFFASSYNNSGTHQFPQLPYNTYQDNIMFIIRVDTLGIDPMTPCLCNRLIICLSTEPVFNNNC